MLIWSTTYARKRRTRTVSYTHLSSWANGSPNKKAAKFRIQTEYCKPIDVYTLICNYIEIAKQSAETDQILAYDIEDIMG